MLILRHQLLVCSIVISLCCFAIPTAAQEPGWWGVVIADDATKARIEQVDILQRPYRLFHFYGNTVRRMYYRGNLRPTLRDVGSSVRALRYERSLARSTTW